MIRECSWKRTEEVQIDLLDLLHRLCRQWKRIVVCALIFAVLAGAGSYALSKNGGIEDAAGETEVLEEPVPLTREEQIQGVEAARQLAQETEALEAYMADSVLMQVDPYHKNSVQLLFRVEDAAGWTMQKIVEKYLSFLVNDEALDAIQKKDSRMRDIDKCYLSELFWIVQKTSGTYLNEEGSTMSGVLLSAEATGVDAAMAAGLAADIQAVLEEYHAAVEKECGRHTLTLLSSEEKERVDSSLLSQQREKRTLLQTDRANLKAMIAAFDDEQKVLYAAARAESTEKVQEGSETQENEGLDGQSELESDAASEERKGSVSVLYVLFGFFGGIFVYCAVYAVWYLMRDTVKSVGEFRSYYTFPFYGSIDLHSIAGRNLTGKDSAGDGTGQDVYEREKAQLLNRIRLSCKKQGVSRFCLAADFSLREEERACMDSLLSQLRDWGFAVELAENICGNISMWDTLMETGTVLMLCRLGSTTHRMIDDAMEFYLENGVSVLGAAALE